MTIAVEVVWISAQIGQTAVVAEVHVNQAKYVPKESAPSVVSRDLRTVAEIVWIWKPAGPIAVSAETPVQSEKYVQMVIVI